MNTAQRICLAVAAAAALAVIARFIIVVWTSGPSGGWFMYEPDSEVAFYPGDRYRNDALKEAGVWLAAVAAWLVVVWRTFRTKGARGAE